MLTFTKIFFCLFLSITVLAQSIIYDSGLCYMRKYREICKCNHNSRKEIHKPTSRTSDCLDNTKAVHICACKKTKNPNEISNLIKQTFLNIQEKNFLYIHFIKYLPSLSYQIFYLDGYKLTLIKPPRSI